MTLLSLATLWAASLPAGAQATSEKCTCDLQGAARDSGAEVRNAAACFSSDFPARNWCEIDVEALWGTDAHIDLARGVLGDAGAEEASADRMLSLFGRYVFETNGGAAFEASQESLWSVIEPALAENGQALGTCTRAYAQRAEGRSSEPAGAEGLNLRCMVSVETGWLQVQVSLPDLGAGLSFRLAPPPE